MDEILKYKITADTEGLVQGFEESQKEIKQLEKTVDLLKKRIDGSTKSTKIYEEQISNLNKAYKDGFITQKKFEDRLKRVQTLEKKASTETKKLESELKKLNQRHDDLNNSTPKLEKNTEGLGNSFKGVGDAAKKVVGDIGGVPKELGDVGKGVEVVANGLVELQKSSGATTLSGLVSSFLGPQGLIFALTTAATLLTLYGDKLGFTASLSKQLAEATKDGIASAQGEISTLQSLIKIANDETKSKETRLIALNRINEKYGDYLGNLTLEELGTNRVKDAVNNLTRSLIKQAQVRGAQDLIEEKSKDTAEDLSEALTVQLQKQELVREELKNLTKEYGFLSKVKIGDDLTRSIQEIQDLVNKNGGTRGGILDTLKFTVDGFNEAKAAAEGLQAETEASLAPLQKLINQLTFEDILLESKGIGKASVDLEVTVTAEEQKKRDAKIQKIRDDIQKELNKITADLDLVDTDKQAELARDVEKIFVKSGAAAASAIQDLNANEFDLGVFEEEKKIIALENRIKSLKSTVDANTFNLLQNMSTEQLDIFEERLKTFGVESKIFADSAAGAIGAIGSSLAKAIKTDSEVLDAFIGSILQSVTQLLSQLATNAIKNIAIKQAEATAGAVVAGTESAAAGGPAAAFLLPGLIAGSIGLVAAAFGGLKFASGGIVPGGFGVGDSVPALLTSGEMVLNGRQQSEMFRQLDSGMKNSGGDPMANINFEAVLRGTDIYLSTQRQGRQNKRFNS